MPVTREVLQQLAEPFAADDYEWRVQTAGEKNGKCWAKVLAYVTNRAIMQRLDDVVGPENWKNEYRASPGAKESGVLCGLSIRVASASNPDGEWVTKWDGADETDIEPTKGGLSGSMKRAAVQWGIGRVLYDLDEGWAVVSESGRFTAKTKEGKWFKWDPPALPAWALPKRTTATQPSQPATKPAPAASAPAVPAGTPADRATTPAAAGGAPGSAPNGAGPQCPKCGGAMWDNRTERDGSPKRNPKAPDFKCKDKACDGVIWPAPAGRDATGKNLADPKTITFPKNAPPQLRDLAGRALGECTNEQLRRAVTYLRTKGDPAGEKWIERCNLVLEERRLTGDPGPKEGPTGPVPRSIGDLPGDPAEAA